MLCSFQGGYCLSSLVRSDPGAAQNRAPRGRGLELAYGKGRGAFCRRAPPRNCKSREGLTVQALARSLLINSKKLPAQIARKTARRDALQPVSSEHLTAMI